MKYSDGAPKPSQNDTQLVMFSIKFDRAKSLSMEIQKEGPQNFEALDKHLPFASFHWFQSTCCYQHLELDHPITSWKDRHFE